MVRVVKISLVIGLAMILLPYVLETSQGQEARRITFAITTNTEGELNPCG